ncbi:hypothetical protein AKJ16_DCAP17935 [Drosera capensis]
MILLDLSPTEVVAPSSLLSSMPGQVLLMVGMREPSARKSDPCGTSYQMERGRSIKDKALRDKERYRSELFEYNMSHDL